jgi:hypothetical protein
MSSAGRISLFLFLILILCSCEDKFRTFDVQTITVANNKRDTRDTINKPGVQDTVMTDSTGKFRFSRLRFPSSRGLTATCMIEETHREKPLWIVFSGRVRSNYAHSNATITMAAVSPENGMLVWNGSLLRYYITDVNRWCHFRDSFYLESTFTNKPYGEVSVFTFLGDSEHENFDVDTLHVEFREATD